MGATQRRLAEAGVGRARARLDLLEETCRRLEAAMSTVEDLAERVARLEEEAWLPTSRALQRRRHEAVRELRREGLSITSIAEAVGMSRSRVAALVRELPTPERVVTVTGRSYPAAAMAEHERRNGDGADRQSTRPRAFVDTTWSVVTGPPA